MASQSVALASLTETYTDSEESDSGEGKNNPQENTKENKDSKTSPKTETVGVAKGSLTKLVSYNDDVVLSEDETHEVESTKSSDDDDDDDNEFNIFNAEDDDDSDDDDDVQLPPEPSGRCSQELQEKIEKLYEKMCTTGLDMNQVIQQRKEFRNPSIYEKLIQFCDINEFGTNFPPEIYDPLKWGKESYYDELDKAQREENSRKEKERKEKEKTKFEYVVGTLKRTSGGSNPGSGAEDESKRRKSKWDQVGNVPMVGPSRSATVLPQPALTSSATGTKSTVISAFGSLPKKPK